MTRRRTIITIGSTVIALAIIGYVYWNFSYMYYSINPKSIPRGQKVVVHYTAIGSYDFPGTCTGFPVSSITDSAGHEQIIDLGDVATALHTPEAGQSWVSHLSVPDSALKEYSQTGSGFIDENIYSNLRDGYNFFIEIVGYCFPHDTARHWYQHIRKSVNRGVVYANYVVMPGTPPGNYTVHMGKKQVMITITP